MLKSIGRGWALFSQYFSKYHKSFNEEFQKAFQMSVEEYYVCVTAIAVNYMNPKVNSGLFNVNELVNTSPYGHVVKKYLNLECQTADEFKVAL